MFQFIFAQQVIKGKLGTERQLTAGTKSLSLINNCVFALIWLDAIFRIIHKDFIYKKETDNVEKFIDRMV